MAGAEEHPGEQHARDRAAALEDALQTAAEQRLLAERGQHRDHRHHHQPVGGRRCLQPLDRRRGAQREGHQLDQQDRDAPPGQPDADGERALNGGNRPPAQGVPKVRMLPPEEEEGREQDGPELGQHETRPGKGQLERADCDHQEQTGRKEHDRLSNGVSFGVGRHAMISGHGEPQCKRSRRPSPSRHPSCSSSGGTRRRRGTICSTRFGATWWSPTAPSAMRAGDMVPDRHHGQDDRVMWNLNGLSPVSSIRLMGGLALRLACGRCKLRRGSQGARCAVRSAKVW